MSHHHQARTRHPDRHHEHCGGDRREMRGGFGGRRFGRHRHGGRGRPFEQGELRFVLLQLLAEAPRHGYELIKDVEDKLGGAYSPSPGVIYPTLTLLEELGYATVESTDGARQLYTATPEGRAFLDANRTTVDAIFARMQTTRGSHAAPPVLRAVENLKLALSLKLSQSDLDEDRIRRIAAIIDAAAVEIERA